MTQHLPTRKRIHLPAEAYDGPGAFSVTIATAQRRRTFVCSQPVDLCLLALSEASRRHDTKLLAHCFMPDHLHLLLEMSPESNLIRFMKTFKQLSSHRYRKAFGGPLWQKGYYDHALRREEDVNEMASYILQNPVHGGLVDSIDEYRFVGGTLAGDLKVAPTPSDGARVGVRRGRRLDATA